MIVFSTSSLNSPEMEMHFSLGEASKLKYKKIWKKSQLGANQILNGEDLGSKVSFAFHSFIIILYFIGKTLPQVQ